MRILERFKGFFFRKKRAYIRYEDAKFNLPVMLSRHCVKSMQKRNITLENIEKDFKLIPENRYWHNIVEKRYRVVTSKYVYIIWYNWLIITIYDYNEENMIAQDEMYKRKSIDWKVERFERVELKNIWWVIRRFITNN